MPKYNVTLEERVYYTVEVEARDEVKAAAIAIKRWNKSPDPTHDFCGAGTGVEVDDVELIEEEATNT
ncbi:hypothetical protein UFOVP706_28 [uncultured Caudovirales phage]|uniref:Uncharacterized protein n=1 Tax=uncultured Caudovirales phage TaxID=2100421 RepID=A0A6J5NP47_9CAUD|nr:hypothetical protein UFOVP706_28 [uncultured Caudovirales phage]